MKHDATDNTTTNGGGCPVKHSSGPTTTETGTSSSLRAWFGMSQAMNNNTKNNNNDNISQELPASVEESLQHIQLPMPDQKIPLNTHRVISSIPKSTSHPTPAHQSDTIPENASHNHWVYPSEQQFYNAMRRKGWEAPDESNMASVIQIHNAVNEQSWREVKKWEKEIHDCDCPKLVRFLGRPKDTSPKAWIFSNLLFYKPPFDRHDWYVESQPSSSSTQQETPVVTRYVIDFYEGGSSSFNNNTNNLNARPVSMYLDVRPALDSPTNVLDRVKMAVKELLPGIFPSNSR